MPPSELSPISRINNGLPIGVSEETLTCWEYNSLTLSAGDLGDLRSSVRGKITISKAEFGDPDDLQALKDITLEVQEMLLNAIAEQGDNFKVEIPATTRQWGDPARFRMKKLSVTYKSRWLEDDEQQALERLRHRVTAKAQEAEDLEPMLERLGRALLPSAPAEAQARALNPVSPRWGNFGFQSSDPRTDLRTGRLALECLLYFAERYPEIALQVVGEARTDSVDYPFAVASINVTHHLARCLGLSGEGDGMTVSRTTLQHFARTMLRSESSGQGRDAFAELQCATVRRLHSVWCSLKEKTPTLTVMDFEPCMRDTILAARHFLRTADLDELKNYEGLASGAEEEGGWTVLTLEDGEPEEEAARSGLLGTQLGRRGGAGATSSSSLAGPSLDSAYQAANTASRYLQSFLGEVATAGAAIANSVAAPCDEDGRRRVSSAGSGIGGGGGGGGEAAAGTERDDSRRSCDCGDSEADDQGRRKHPGAC